MPSSQLTFTRRQLQRKFKHAHEFGVDGNNNPGNQDAFRLAVLAHVDSPATQAVSDVWRDDTGLFPVVSFVDPETSLNAMFKLNGAFISGWLLNPAALAQILLREPLQAIAQLLYSGLDVMLELCARIGLMTR